MTVISASIIILNELIELLGDLRKTTVILYINGNRYKIYHISESKTHPNGPFLVIHELSKVTDFE